MTIPTITSIMKEIEYKYFVDIAKLKEYLAKHQGKAAKVEQIQQHYIAKNIHNTVRLRVSTVGNLVERVLCIKTQGSAFNEIEQSVSEAFADAILSDEVVTSSLNKIRFTFGFSLNDHALKLEIDVYQNEWEGLSIAEIEVPSEWFEVPMWSLPDFIIRKMEEDESFIFSNYGLSTLSSVSRRQVLLDIRSMSK